MRSLDGRLEQGIDLVAAHGLDDLLAILTAWDLDIGGGTDHLVITCGTEQDETLAGDMHANKPWRGRKALDWARGPGASVATVRPAFSLKGHFRTGDGHVESKRAHLAVLDLDV